MSSDVYVNMPFLFPEKTAKTAEMIYILNNNADVESKIQFDCRLSSILIFLYPETPVLALDFT